MEPAGISAENNENYQRRWSRYADLEVEVQDVTPLSPSNQMPSPRKLKPTPNPKRMANSARYNDEDEASQLFKRAKLTHNDINSHNNNSMTGCEGTDLLLHLRANQAANSVAASNMVSMAFQQQQRHQQMAAMSNPFFLQSLALQNHPMAHQMLLSQALSASNVVGGGVNPLFTGFIASELAMMSHANPAAMVAMTGGAPVVNVNSSFVSESQGSSKPSSPKSTTDPPTADDDTITPTADDDTESDESSSGEDEEDDDRIEVACLNISQEFLPQLDRQRQPARLCDCGKALCHEIGYPNRGSFEFPPNTSAIHRWFAALDIADPDRRKDIQENPSKYRIAYWHFEPKDRIDPHKRSGGKVRLVKSGAVLPTAHLQAFVDEQMVASKGHAVRRKPRQRMLKLHQYWAQVRRAPTLEP